MGLENMAKKNKNKFTTVGKYDTEPMAYIMKNKLEQEGIESNIVDGKTVSTFSALDSIALGRVKLKVKTEDADKAKKILEAVKLANRCFNCNEEIEVAKYEKCPKCGHQDEKPDYSYTNKFMFFMTIFALLPVIGLLSGFIGLTGFSYKETKKQGIFLFLVSVVSTSTYFFLGITFKLFPIHFF